MLRSLIATSAITAATALAGCGDDDQAKPPRHPAVAKTVETWLHSVAAEDAATACTTLDRRGRRQLAEREGVDLLLPLGSDLICSTAARNYAAGSTRRPASGAARRASRALRVTPDDIVVRGTDQPAVTGQGPFVIRRAEDGSWTIEDLG